MKQPTCLLLTLVAIVPAFALADSETTPEPQPDLVAPSNATERWLDSVIIPEADFRAAQLYDCLEFVLGRVNESAARAKREPMRVLFDLEALRQLSIHPLLPTFRAENISAFRVLKILQELCELEIHSRPRQIIVSARQSANTSLHGSTESRASASSRAP